MFLIDSDASITIILVDDSATGGFIIWHCNYFVWILILLQVIMYVLHRQCYMAVQNCHTAHLLDYGACNNHVHS